MLQKIPEIFHQPQTLTVQQPLPNPQKLEEALEPTIKVIAAKPLTSPSLCRYLNVRKIPFEVAKNNCKEVDFEMNGRQNFAIEFELRNQHFKGCIFPKDVTQIGFSKAKEIAVFKGQFSFRSYLTLQNNFHTMTNFLILNFFRFFKKSSSIMEKLRKINFYLEKDEAGLKYTQNALKWDIKYVGKSRLCQIKKDLNDYLVHASKQQKHSQKPGRHF